MKIKIDPSALETIKALRGKLAARLKIITNSTGDLDRLTADQEKLLSEIATLEGNDSLSEAAASKLAGKRVHLEQIENKISKLSKVDGRKEASDITENTALLKEFARAAAAATSPSVKEYATEIAAKIRPWSNSDEAALRLAYHTPAAASLMGKYRYGFGDFGASASVLKAAIDRADEILSGELNWKWDSKIS